ncbi:DUF892 family protein [Mesorhizobium sp. M0488]|uniref:DUF892 family protein n=1 Tax=unclassified Mesorhizobium TaxID=325217 RepID=UPI0033382AEE
MATTQLREPFDIRCGLRNAHATENQTLSIMEPRVERIEDYPEAADRLRRHSPGTEGQITRIEAVLEGLDTEHSILTETALSMVGSMAAMGHSMAGDEIIKNSLANFTFDYHEIAAYNSLLVPAEAALKQNLS